MSVLEDTASADEVDLSAMFRVFRERAVLIGFVALLAALLALALALTTEPVFRAETVLTEARDRMNGGGGLAGQLGGLASLAGASIGDGGPGQEAKALLQSRRIVELFIERNGLLSQLAVEGKPPPTMWKAVKRFRGSILSVREDTRKGLVTVSISWRDPVVAARWANQLVELVNETLRARAVERARQNVAYLNRQIASTQSLELQRVMHNLIETEMKTLMLANGRREYAFEVIDPAVVPEERVWPKRSLMVAVGGAFGLLLGCGVALVLNAVGRRRESR